MMQFDLVIFIFKSLLYYFIQFKVHFILQFMVKNHFILLKIQFNLVDFLISLEVSFLNFLNLFIRFNFYLLLLFLSMFLNSNPYLLFLFDKLHFNHNSHLISHFSLLIIILFRFFLSLNLQKIGPYYFLQRFFQLSFFLYNYHHSLFHLLVIAFNCFLFSLTPELLIMLYLKYH